MLCSSPLQRIMLHRSYLHGCLWHLWHICIAGTRLLSRPSMQRHCPTSGVPMLLMQGFSVRQGLQACRYTARGPKCTRQAHEQAA